MVAPATDAVAQQFGITSAVMIAMTTSIFVLAYGKLSRLLHILTILIAALPRLCSHRPTRKLDLLLISQV